MKRVLVWGDAPNEPTGLGRIARDITSMLHHLPDVKVYQAGLRYDGSIWPWHVFPIHDEKDWGDGDLQRILRQLDFPARMDLRIITVWDPARCYNIATRIAKLKEAFDEKAADLELWGYFAIDSHNDLGTISGPAAAAVGLYDRVLAYSRFGKTVLEPVTNKRVRWIPHIVGEEFQIKDVNADEMLQAGLDPMKPLVGVVATNQPRKDLGLVFKAMKILNESYLGKVSDLPPAQLWLHTDHLYRHWAITELAEIYGFNNELLYVTTYLDPMSMVDMYNLCAVTIAPGLGEGFGYPIVESMACGVPVLHGDFAAGPEWMPPSWCITPNFNRVEGIYALRRPLFSASAFASLLYGLLRDKPDPEWVRLQVRHLRTDALLPLWRKWLSGKPEDDVIKEDQ